MAALLVVLVVVVLLLLAVAGPPAPVVPSSAARLRLRRLLVRARLVDGGQGGGPALALVRPAGEGKNRKRGRGFPMTESLSWRDRMESFGNKERKNQREREKSPLIQKGRDVKIADSRMFNEGC